MADGVINRIYMDNSATTRCRDEVFELAVPFLREFYGNPSSIYREARDAKKALETAREKVAAAIGATPREIYFTGGGSEADNWAIIGLCEANNTKGRHIVTTAIEHHGVLNTCAFLEKRGYEVTYVGVDEDGLVSADDVQKAIRPDTVLVTVMAANNEVGTIQPIEEIGAICHDTGVLFHTDAVQAAGHIPIDVSAINCHSLAISGHKLYAPKGIGALYLRDKTKITPLINGGAQERGRRAGTENVFGAVALGAAIELAAAEIAEEAPRLAKIRDRLIEGLTAIPDVKLNGHREKRMPGNVNVSFKYIEGESILLLLDMKGICASSGSACTSGSLDPSHVLLAMGLPHETAHGSLRLSLGLYNTEAEAETVLREVPPIIARLREMSPLIS